MKNVNLSVSRVIAIRNFMMAASQLTSSGLHTAHIYSTDNEANFADSLSWLASCESYYGEGMSLSSSSGAAVKSEASSSGVVCCIVKGWTINTASHLLP